MLETGLRLGISTTPSRPPSSISRSATGRWCFASSPPETRLQLSPSRLTTLFSRRGPSRPRCPSWDQAGKGEKRMSRCNRDSRSNGMDHPSVRITISNGPDHPSPTAVDGGHAETDIKNRPPRLNSPRTSTRSPSLSSPPDRPRARLANMKLLTLLSATAVTAHCPSPTPKQSPPNPH